MSQKVNTWNSAFNDLAERCGVTVDELYYCSQIMEIDGARWQRIGDKVQVCCGNAVWTVDIADLTPNA